MTDEKDVVRIVGLALVRDRKILLVRKRGLSSLILPGGKPEEDEFSVAALQRELSEEIGTKIRPETISAVGIFTGPAAGQEDVEVRVDLMTGVLEEEPTASGEIEELVWVDLDDYEGLDLAPSLRLKILPYVAGTLPLGRGRPWEPRSSDCRACGQTLAFNCRDCRPGEEELCDAEGCASGRAVNGHNVPLIRTDPVDAFGGWRVLDLVGALEDRIVGPGYVLISGGDSAALVARAAGRDPGPGGVTLGVGPDDRVYSVSTMADGKITFRGVMTAEQAARLGPREAPEDVQVGLTQPLRRGWSSGPTPGVQAVPRGAPHLARIFEESESAVGTRVTRVAYDGTDVSYLQVPVSQHPFPRQIYAGDASALRDSGESPGGPGVAGGYTAPPVPADPPEEDTQDEGRFDAWFWFFAAVCAALGLVLVWNYLVEPMIFT